MEGDHTDTLGGICNLKTEVEQVAGLVCSSWAEREAPHCGFPLVGETSVAAIS